MLILSLVNACSSNTPSATQSEQHIEQKTTVTQQQEKPENNRNLGSTEYPLKIYLTPSRTSELVEKTGATLVSFLEKETGLNFALHVPESYEEMIDAFASQYGDIAMMNSASYIKANQLYGATAKLRAVRYGKSNYFGQIVANTNSGVLSLSDLNGKSIAYTDSLSASGYLFPKHILEQQGILPGHMAFAGTHDRVIKMVYKGIADAGATFYSEPSSDGEIRDARSRLVKEYPDVADKVKIIEVTEPIPNDPVVFGQHISKDIYYPVSLGIIKFLETEEGKAAMSDLYSIEGYVRCKDSDYDGLRAVLN
nr:phosphate/phosphite/phosphonate ABC transporter substrate-binding protein [Reichenbachiella agariperforans]